MDGFEGVGLSDVQLSISELSVVGGCGTGWVWSGQMHFMVGPGRGPTKITLPTLVLLMNGGSD